MAGNSNIRSERRVEEVPGRQKRLDKLVLANTELITLREIGFTLREVRKARERCGVPGPGYAHGRGKRWAY